MTEERLIRTLLWSPLGSGEHYQGPALFTYRLYSSAPPGRVAVSLAHGYPEQQQYDLFQSQHCLGNLRKGTLATTAFIRNSRRWLDKHAQEFDILHGISGYHYSVAPAIHAERLGLPAIIFLTAHRADLADKAGIRSLLGLPKKRRKMIQSLSCIVAMTDLMHEELREYGVPESKIARIPMGVNTEVFKPVVSQSERLLLRSRLGWRDLPTIIFVGAIVPRKAPHLLVEAVGMLKQRGYECQLVLAGPENDSVYATNMKTRAKELGVTDYIAWAGFVRDISTLFRASDIFCLPSSNEGMAAAIVEGMACGLATVVTPVSGSRDIVDDEKNGRIVEASVKELSATLMDYLRSPKIREDHGRNARLLVKAKYSNSAVFAAYQELFHRIISGGDAAE